MLFAARDSRGQWANRRSSSWATICVDSSPDAIRMRSPGKHDFQKDSTLSNLFRPGQSFSKHERCFQSGRVGPGLAAAYAHAVVSRRSDPHASFIDHAQVSRAETKLNVAHSTLGNMDPGKSGQGANRRSVAFRKTQVELNHLVSIPITDVGHVHIDQQRFL